MRMILLAYLVLELELFFEIENLPDIWALLNLVNSSKCSMSMLWNNEHWQAITVEFGLYFVSFGNTERCSVSMLYRQWLREQDWRLEKNQTLINYGWKNSTWKWSKLPKFRTRKNESFEPCLQPQINCIYLLVSKMRWGFLLEV